jgi:hypothetical protein
MKRSVIHILFAVACFMSVPSVVFAQALSPVMPPGHGAAPGAATPPTTQTFDVLALRATQEGNLSKNFGEELRPVREILEMLPYDTYGTLSQVEREAPFGEETAILINESYTFHVLPLEQHESGEVEVMARIAMHEVDETLDALWAQGKAAPGKALVFQSSENPPEDQEGDEQESDGEQQDSESEAQQNEEQETPEESEAGEEPKDLKNLEAILRSLEDLDRREQEEARNQRDAIRLQGDWW